MGSCLTAMRFEIWPSKASEIILCCKICLKSEASAYSTAAVLRVNMVGKDWLKPEALVLLARRMRIAKQKRLFLGRKQRTCWNSKSVTALGCGLFTRLTRVFIRPTSVLQHISFNTLLKGSQNSGGIGGGPTAKYCAKCELFRSQ